MALTPMPSHDVAGVIAEGVGVSLSGGLARRSRVNLKRYNSDPSPSVMDPPSKFVIGVCAMDKKARSKPMTAILQRIMSFNEFEVIVFGDQTILEKPVEEWPLCDCLLSWHSDGFPLAKAQAYVQLRHPFCVNDSLQQEALLDRRMVYQTLKANGIPVPHHIVVSRDHPSDNAENGATAPLADPPGFVEELDWVEKDGVRITKPFVEKPVSGENHNIYIYYHSSHGGGVKRLFRKVDDKSADYDSNHPGNVRRDGSYIYEEFLTTGGTDVKVYTVGPRYAHAEARKSPVVDGKVHRASDGKEMRYPVLLSPQEKEISRMVCLAFSQKVCGFDLLRSEKGKSYVCDVNGWSFVKNSTKYLDDAAGILRSMILTALAPQRVMTMPMLLPAPIPTLREDEEEGVVVPNAQRVGQYQSQSMKNVASLQDIAMGGLDEEFNEHEELRCVLAVVRHGDRTPKQKFKCKVSQPALLALFDKHRNSKGDQAKLKNPLQLQEFLGVVRKLVDAASAALADIAAGKPLDSTEHPELGKVKMEKEPIEDFFQQMSIVLTVMEQGGGHFSGVNRKVQLKPVRLRGQDLTLRPSASEPAMAGPPPSPGPHSLTPTPSSAGGAGLQLEEALLVVKWGGVLTHAGRGQAEQLGQQFRATMYPRHGPAGGGLLRLHSTYRHDLKIYSSDEGRVQVSAAAFTKGLLDLEGNSLTPILVSLVNKDASMLEAFGKGASEEMQACKDVIQAQLTHDPAKGPPPPIRAVLPVPSGVQSNASPSPPFSPRPPIIQPGQPRKPPASTSQSGGPANAATAALGVVRAPSGHLAAPTAAAALAAWNATHAPSPSRGNSPGLPLVPDPRVTPRDMVIVEAPPGSSPTSLQQADLGRSMPNLLPVITVGAPVVSSAPYSTSTSGGGDSGGAASRLGGLALPGSALGGSSLRRTTSAAGDAAAPSTPVEQPQSPLVLHIDKLMHMPDQPLALLQSLRSMMRTLVDQLQDMCAKEAEQRAAGSGPPPVKAYNSQSQAPDEWELTPTQPCSGEKLVLLHDRWRKLYDAVYSEKKQQFDISKIPDIYDSVKHDAIHNAHLGLPLLKDLYAASKALADVVIPQEYGLEPRSKLSIGSKIAKELVGKLLADMSSMKMESESTAVEMGDSSMVQGSGDELYGPGGDTMATEFGRNCLEDDRLRNRHGTLSAVFNRHSTHTQGAGDEAAGAGGDDLEDSARHRLCPTYASDINSPLRHVRTRIYYTSESHIHSLMNVLRFCYLREGVTTPLVGEEMQKLLDATPENDYLTHVVFRMFENLSMPVGDPARFRVEVLFSPGAACNPITQTPADHTLPVVQLEQLNAGVAQTFHEIENLLAPFAVARKVQASYALSVALKAPSNPLSRTDSSMIRSASGNNLSKQRSSTGGANRESITGRLSNATGSSSSSCLNHLDRTSDSHGTSGGSVSACVHCPESADGSAGGAAGSAMAGLVSELVKMTSLPIRAKEQQQLTELLQEPTTPRQQRHVAKLLGVDSITPELGDVLDRLEISSASSGPAIILHGLNLG